MNKHWRYEQTKQKGVCHIILRVIALDFRHVELVTGLIGRCHLLSLDYEQSYTRKLL